jgi:hypothetical protein
VVLHRLKLNWPQGSRTMKQILRAISKALHKGRHPEMVEFKTHHEPQMDETAVQQTLPTTTVEEFKSGRANRSSMTFTMAEQEPHLGDLHEGREPEMVELKTEQEPHLGDLHEGREPEMVEFKTHHEPQLDETAVQLTLPPRRMDEAIWLEERPKVIEAIKSGVAALRKTSAQMRTNRAVRDAEKTDTNNS